MRTRASAWVLLFAAYVGAVLVGDSVIAVENVKPVWPASGVAVVGLLLCGPPALPVVFLADLAANALTANPLEYPTVLGTAAANLVEAVLAVAIMRRGGFDVGLSRWRDVAALTTAAVVAAAIGASAGVGALLAGGATDSGWTAWRAWAPGDVVGIVTVVALIGVWRRTPNWRRHRAEWLAGFLLLTGAAVLAFTQDVEALYLLFPFLIWAPMRFGRHGATAAATLIAVVSVGATAHHEGPFARDDAVGGIISLQVFLAMMFLMALAFAALRHERGRADAELRHRALYDELTDLPNRTLLSDRIRQAAGQAGRRGTGLAVLLLDFDRFRIVNDGLGPQAGDDVLRQLARRVAESLRTGDTIGRFGGDQFVIVLEDCDLRQAVAAAERLEQTLQAPVRVRGDELYVTASVGIAHTTGADDAEVLLRNAGAAMARAKRQGGGGFEVHDADARARVRSRLSTEAALRRAVERDELRLHYQPIITAGDGRVCGCEALLRWEHPEDGLLAPAHFIGIAEETGLIVPIGAWALRAACTEVRRWPEPVGVWVNFAPVQVERRDFVAGVRDVLDECGCDPARLVVEITESALARDVAPALAQVRDLGVRLALDDFGSGYASLGDVQRFALDIIKLDRRFVAALEEGSRAEAIVDAVVRMATALDLQSVAEGIETAEQLRLVSRLGYTFAQGFHIRRPVDAAAVREMLEGDRVRRP